MTFGSVCSGIEAASVAWHALGWKAAWLAEIEPFPAAVLAHHYPEVENLGDMTTIAPRVLAGEVQAPDVLVGGTPCQSFSVAGLRRSLDDDRGNLALEFVRLAGAIDVVRSARGEEPAWVLWENVPGVLSTKDNAFGCFLGGLVGADAPIVPPRGKWPGAGVVAGPSRVAAWRVLDAQHFGVAQRRRRVFVLARGGSGAWSAADALLPITESVRWHPAPSRETRASSPANPAAGAGVGGVAGPPGAHATGGWDPGDLERNGALIPEIARIAHGQANAEARTDGGAPSLTCIHEAPVVAFDTTQITSAANRSSPRPGDPCHPLAAAAAAPAVAFNITPEGGQGADLRACEIDVAPALDASQEARKQGRGTRIVTPILEPGRRSGRSIEDVRIGTGIGEPGDPMFTLQAGGAHGVHAGMSVRRLTPTECERLQGFPDDYTLVPWKRGESPDGPRYRALGNSMAVPVMAHIGRAIQREEGKR